MARFRALVKMVIGDRMVSPGDIITLPPGMLASRNLQPLDDEAVALRQKREARFAETAPPGSVSDREISLAIRSGEPPTEAQVRALYDHRPKKTPTPGGMVETVSWVEGVERTRDQGAKS